MSPIALLPLVIASLMLAVEALLPLIAVYTAPGNVILDPFARSSITAIAAKQLQRRYIAIAMEPQPRATASHRLQAAVLV